MKIYLAEHEPGRVGGGWSFQDNIAKAMSDDIADYEHADIYLIAGPSMVRSDEVWQAKKDGKKIVVRCDGIPRNSRNRSNLPGTVMSRMKDFVEWSDLVVYQTEFARKLLDPYLKAKNYTVILNSVDQQLFKSANKPSSEKVRYLYARSSSDETKNYQMARSAFQEIAKPKKITILGKAFGPDLTEHNFDFYMDEEIEFLGEIDDKQVMARVYQSHDVLLYSFFNDCCSNTLIEALSCGMRVHDCYGMLKTGGAPEIMKIKDMTYFDLPRMAAEYYEALAQL